MSTPLVEQKPFNGHTPGEVFVFDDTIAARETPDDGGDIISSAPAEYECSMRRWQDNAAFLAHCWNTYYQREAELQSMRERLSRMEAALRRAHESICYAMEEGVDIGGTAYIDEALSNK